MEPHSTHAAGTEALPTGISREDILAEQRRLEEEDPTQLAHHCTSAVPILMLHSEGTPPSVTVLCTAFVMCPVPNTSLPTGPLATLLGMHHAGFEVSVRYAGVGGAAGHWSRCWVSPSHHVPPAPPCLELVRLCHCFYILWLL